MRSPARLPEEIPASVFGSPALFLPASLVLQNQGLFCIVSTASFLKSGVYLLLGTPFGIVNTPFVILSNEWGAAHFLFMIILLPTEAF